ncbi:uridine kinase [Bacillaceae bacterium SAS-127]|nr:uridine kinase [Bacillaceae bacterium SAS-127]
MSEEILLRYIQLLDNNRPLIVGIDGLGGSGKTTIVKKIKQELINKNYEVVSFHLDDHIVERNKRYETGHEEWYEYYYLQWDVKSLKANLFEPLHSRYDTISLFYYDKFTDLTSIKKMEIKKGSIVLIEGIFLQRPEWVKFYDFIIFLDCLQEVRYGRVLKRDSYIGDYRARLGKYQRRYWLAEKYYMDVIDPIKNADLVYKT